MSANPELERAMTHNVDGRACLRPQDVRAIAGRMIAWRDAPATCQHCLTNDATRMLSGIAYCVRCRDNRQERMEDVRRIDPASGEWHGRLRDTDAAVMEGHSIVVNSLSQDLGGFKERVMPEALNRTFRERRDMVFLWNHNSDLPLARLSEGGMAIRKDDTGLMVRVSMPQSATAQLEAVTLRTVKQQSFGFHVLEDEWILDGAMPLRHLTDIRVQESSAVVFPAYEATDIGVMAHAVRGASVAFLSRVHRARMAR